MKKLLLLLLLVTINVTAQGNPDKFRDGIKTPFTQYNELTTTQKLALPQVTGTVVYDTTLEKLQVFDGVNWVGYFNAALDTADDIIEGNTNKLLTVFERDKLGNIEFDNSKSVLKIGRDTGVNATGTNLTATGSSAASGATGNLITATGSSAALGATGFGITATGASSSTNSVGDFITATGVNAAQNAIGLGITSVGFAAGSFPSGNTLQTSNSTAIGANTIIDKANQAAIGNTAVTELKIGETLVVDKSQIVTGAEGFLVTKKLGGKTVVEVETSNVLPDANRFTFDNSLGNLNIKTNKSGDTFLEVSNLGAAGPNTTSSIIVSETPGAPKGWFRRYRDGSNRTSIGFSGVLTFDGDIGGTPVERMRIDASGNIIIQGGVYADDAAAGAAGVPQNGIYKTTNGEIRYKL